MQGFINLAADIGQALAVLVPFLCYTIGGSFILGSGWGFWQMAKPGSWFQSRPWVPFTTLFIGATLLSFDRMLNYANNTIGGGTQTSLSQVMTSYTAPTADGSSIVGNSPEDTLTNIIYLFEYFFLSYGALMVLLGVLALKGISEGTRRHGPSLALVQIVFGLAVMNIDTIAPGIMSYFANATPAT